jgi:RecB family exonuclease
MADWSYKVRTRNLYDPASAKQFRISRSKIDLFIECPRCFYMDRRLGVGRPAGFPFRLNSLVDELLKREFDHYRKRGEPHPLMVESGIEAVPFAHPQLNRWRDALRAGVEYHDQATNLVITGGIDDVWVNPAKELIVADYKATAKDGEVSIDAPWQDGYKRQLEVYQWLFRRNGFRVSDTGYFVYCNGDTSREAFEARIDFKIKLIPYTGSDGWIGQAIQDLAACLNQEELPAAGPDCDYCKYRAAAGRIEA